MRNKNISGRINYILFIISVLLFQSCKVAYIPSMENVPILQKKGDIEANLTPANFQGAFSPIDHLGLMINGQSSLNTETSDGNTNYKARRQFVEGAIGYYTMVEPDKTFEIFGGAGYGSLSFHDNIVYSDQKYSASMLRTFVQPSISFLNENIEFAFSVRFLQLKFTDIQTNNYDDAELQDDRLYQLDRQPFYFAEPAFTLRAGWKHVKAQFQYLYSCKVNTQPINYYPMNFFIGLSLRF
ncbi:MAG: hypothetical protein NTU44_12725 [Bacteroidetes bacterium]|nr:hypothetical protein [Bacteroidota bacterium]